MSIALGFRSIEALVLKRGAIAIGLAAVAMPLLMVPAQAALTSVSPPCTDSTTTPPYVACSGAFEGNDTPQTADILAALANLSGTDGWFAVGKSDAANSGPFVSNPGTNSGTLTFDTPITGQFTLSLKAANAFSLFYYNTSALTEILDTLGVSVNQNGIAQGLSHATLYAVPEAETYAFMLAGLGLLGLGVAARRRQR
jgi:hypothetical protein